MVPLRFAIERTWRGERGEGRGKRGGEGEIGEGRGERGRLEREMEEE